MKNTVKYITYINRFILVTTLLLYVTFFLGMIAQFVLGFSQVISFLILLIFHEKFTKKDKNLLLVYFSAVLLFFLVSVLFKDAPRFPGVVIFFTSSMGIAIYFTYLLETLNTKIW